MVHHIDLSWNTLEPGLVLMYEKLSNLGWVCYGGEMHTIGPETEESQRYAPRLGLQILNNILY